jgi:Reverse transcriptase (RNA-dependent DNA polymerase)
LFQVRKTKAKGILLKLDFAKVFDRIKDYLQEVLQTRGFGQKWIKWVMDLLTSGQTNIIINGQQTPYFTCKRGLRQDDLLSPLLFNLATDTLAKILNKAKEEGYLKSLANFNNQNIINLNYADDTLLFLQADLKMLEALKLILIGFENLTGLKINYTKSELIPLIYQNKRVIIWHNYLVVK